MLVYVIGFAMPIVFLCVKAWPGDNFIKRHFTDKRILVWISVYLFLISALRHVSIGADTVNYEAMFERMAAYGIDNYLKSQSRTTEIGYTYFQYVCSWFTSSPQVFLGIIAAIVSTIVGRFVWKYSKNSAWSMFFYMTYFFQFYGLTGLRQTMAAMLLLLSYDFVYEKKPVKFFITVGIATTFHYSALVFLPMYFIANIKLTQKQIFAFLVVLVALFMARDSFLGFLTDVMVRVTEDIYYDQYRAGTFNIMNYFLMALAITVLCLYRYKQTIEANPYANHWYNAILLALLFAPTGNTRIMQYFWIFIVPLFPEVLGELKSKDKLIVGIGLPLILGALMLLSYSKYTAIAPYRFFWQ